MPKNLNVFASEKIILNVHVSFRGICVLLKCECKSSCNIKLSFACINFQKSVWVFPIFFSREACKNWGWAWSEWSFSEEKGIISGLFWELLRGGWCLHSAGNTWRGVQLSDHDFVDLNPIKVELHPYFSQGSSFATNQEFHSGILPKRTSAHTTAQDHEVGASCATWSRPLVGAHSAHYVWPVQNRERNPNRTTNSCGQQVGGPSEFWGPRMPGLLRTKHGQGPQYLRRGLGFGPSHVLFLCSEYRTSLLLQIVHGIHLIIFFIYFCEFHVITETWLSKMHWIFSCWPWSTSISQESAVLRKTIEHPLSYNPPPGLFRPPTALTF